MEGREMAPSGFRDALVSRQWRRYVVKVKEAEIKMCTIDLGEKDEGLVIFLYSIQAMKTTAITHTKVTTVATI